MGNNQSHNPAYPPGTNVILLVINKAFSLPYTTIFSANEQTQFRGDPRTARHNSSANDPRQNRPIDPRTARASMANRPPPLLNNGQGLLPTPNTPQLYGDSRMRSNPAQIPLPPVSDGRGRGRR